jgi:VWFA-related protein
MRQVLLFCLTLSLFTTVSAQQSSSIQGQQVNKPQNATQNTSQDEVVKLGVTLVQVDAIVTDKNGRHVTDLKADDFELYEDGKKQKITNFSYVVTQPDSANPAVKSKNSDKTSSIIPPVQLRPEEVRRTIALVIDDLQLSHESFKFVRQSLRKFVDEQMQPGDLAAVIRTGAGRGVLQQFTSDKRQLHAAIERVRWNPSGRGGLSAYSAINSEDTGNDDSNSTDPGKRADARSQNDVNKFRDELFAVGTIATLNLIARGLKDFPGRKSVILFSDGLTLFSRTGDDNTRIMDALRRLIDAANRASVVFYAIDSRGLQTLDVTAADDTRGQSLRSLQEQMQRSRSAFYYSQEGLIYLAKQTGGLSFLNTNDLSRGINRALEDQKGYYLLGYVPDETTFNTPTGRKTFHNLKVKVKRPGVEARFRTGFFGVPESETARPLAHTKQQQLHDAISSPFTSGEIPLQLTSQFGYEDAGGLFISSMLHIDVKALTFTDDENGSKKAVIDVGAVTFKDAAQVIDQNWKNYTLTVSVKNFDEIVKKGLVYTIILPVKQAGAYQLRTVVRDSSSAHLGSASQFVEVPDVSLGHLTISGITAQGANPAGGRKNSAEQAEDFQNSPALRRIRSDSMMDYGFWIYNARLDKATNLPKLETQALVLKDGKVVYTGKVNPVEIDATQNLKKIMSGGSLNFINFEPGEYVLQIIVTDKLAEAKHNKTTQWIDFEIIK